ncbi:MAG: hypothetical protein IKR34_00325, partial [Candidatus Gastranaerophilales bacterium]|nr:hypothetical protein [Candidatus Gastranaerophilales bacterium]
MLKKYVKNRDESVAFKAMALAAFAGLSFSAQSAFADTVTVPDEPTLDKLHAQDAEAYPQTSSYSYVDNAESSNTNFSFTQYTIDEETKEITSETTKYININKTSYSDGDLTYSWDTENKKLTVTKSGDAVIIDNIEYVGNSQDYGGAIYNEDAIIGNIHLTGSMAGDFIGNSATNGSGGAVYNNGRITTLTSNFIGNSATSNGGAIYNTLTIDNITGDFIGNSANYGGAIYNEGTIGDITGDFIENSYDAIYNKGTIGDITGDFIENPYGTINNEGTIGDITGNFVENYAAIYNEGTIGDISGDFIENENYAINNLYEG